MKKESSLTQRIAAALRQRGAWVTKLHGGNMQQAGLPDLLVVVAGVVWFLEVKLPGGVVSRIQRHTIERLKASGGNVAVVRSVDEALAATRGPHETDH